MNLIENKNFPCERDLYGADGVHLKNCTFQGVEDGESALKEAKNVICGIRCGTIGTWNCGALS